MKIRISSFPIIFLSVLGTLAPIAFGPVHPNVTDAAVAKVVTSPFLYDFRVAGTLEENNSMDNSSSPYFWLNSGGLFHLVNGVGQTIQGSLSPSNKWYQLYRSSNPVDTDGGTHPQNLFRFVTRSKWQNFSQEVYFKITADNLSSSPNRAGHNGLLLMNRYESGGQTLYYAGVRVDGTAVIKRKLNGSYTTLTQKKVYPGTYNRTSNPNLLPHNTWIGLKSVIKTNSNGSVTVSLFQDQNRTGNWTLLLETTDASNSAIRAGNYAGIRTDFMDIQFDNYRLINL